MKRSLGAASVTSTIPRNSEPDAAPWASKLSWGSVNVEVDQKPYLIEDTSREALHREIEAHVELGSEIHTDEHSGYDKLDNYTRQHIKHGAREYVGASDIHVNSVESMWAVLKRGVYGTWHHVSRKHMARYVNEVTFRLNEGNVKIQTLARMNALCRRAFEHRITYREMTA